MAEDVKVPERWRRVRLGEVIEIFDNKRIPLDSEYRSNIKGNFPYCGATGIIDYINDYIFDGEYVLIAEDGGKFNRFEETAYIMKGKFWANNHVHIVKGKDGILDNYFLMYSFNLQDISYYISGSTREKLNQQLLKSVEIFLPPLLEQSKIAEILETIDNAIEKTDKIIEKYKRIKQGLMQELLTKGIDENGQIRSEETHRFKDSPLGRIPEEWEVVELGDVGDIIYGEGLSQELYEPDGDTLVFGTGGIIGKTKLFLDIGPALVIPRKGSITSVFYIQEGQKFWVIDTAFYLKPKNDYCKFIYFTLCNMDLELLNEATGVPSLNRENIKSILMPLPPLPEQKRIASVLSQIDETIEKEQKYKEKLERIKQGLMEDLLTGKIRVSKLLQNYK
jgi:type I restriction enzyme S subunit